MEKLLLVCEIFLKFLDAYFSYLSFKDPITSLVNHENYSNLQIRDFNLSS